MTKAKEEKLPIDPEFGVDSRYISSETYQLEATALMEARLQRMKNLTKDDVIRAKLMQLKFKMQQFVKDANNTESDSFIKFLQQYIDAIYSKRAVFAEDIGIKPVKLSQIINGHRAPQEDFIYKLIIHSEKVYTNVCTFSKELWYKVYLHEKLNNMMATQYEWHSKLENEVHVSEPIAKYTKGTKNKPENSK